MFPKAKQTIDNKSRVIKTRDACTTPSNKNTLGRVLSNMDWSRLENFDSCEENLTLFNMMIHLTLLI